MKPWKSASINKKTGWLNDTLFWVNHSTEQAEKEVMDLHQRTSEGMKTAKLNGKQIGRIAGKKYTLKKKSLQRKSF